MTLQEIYNDYLIHGFITVLIKDLLTHSGKGENYADGTYWWDDQQSVIRVTKDNQVWCFKG